MKKSFLLPFFLWKTALSRTIRLFHEIRVSKSIDIPKHVAIIMDGNRRWEMKKKTCFGTCSKKGHQRGAEAILGIVPTAKKIGIRTLTLFAFSTENWLRSPEEVSLIFTLITDYLYKQTPYMICEGIRLNYIGDCSKLPASLGKAVTQATEATKQMTEMNLNLAINYGAKNELVRAFNKIHEDINQDKLSKSAIDENLVNSYLDTRGMEEPELLIRTSGEMRISNFLLWQIAYTELYFTKTLWPDFKPTDLLKAVISFQKRIRRRGK